MPAAVACFGTRKGVVQTFACKSAAVGGRAAAAGIAAAILFAPIAFADDPLVCTDRRVLQRIEENLQNASPQKPVELKNPREVLLGAPPRSANQYATATTSIAASRYCEGRAEFEAGTLEPVYWRIDQLNDGPNESSRIDLCHRFFDLFDDDCKAFRPKE